MVDENKKGKAAATVGIGGVPGSAHARQSDELSQELFSELDRQILHEFKSELQLRRPLVVAAICDKLRSIRVSHARSSVIEEGGDSKEWTEISSLSALRGLVGGRFQQLKERWVAAGFPLREHRGDREQEVNFDEAGWIELSRWIGKQGFEVRRARSGEEYIFKIRPSS